MKLLQLLICLVLASPVFSATAPSAARRKHESASEAFERHARALPSSVLVPQNTPHDLAKPLSELDLSRVPQWGPGSGDPVTVLHHLRDHRFLADPEVADLLRRSSWIYPDDGCFARAALMVNNLQSDPNKPLGTVFVFGQLSVSTSNSPEGRVRWWYHVVPIFMAEGVAMVFDPAIDPLRPMELEVWIASMTPDPTSVRVSICHGHTYGPFDSCLAPNQIETTRQALRDQSRFLIRERERIQTLGRNPEAELGEGPPWASRL